jgi:hypothetical protein
LLQFFRFGAFTELRKDEWSKLPDGGELEERADR